MLILLLLAQALFFQCQLSTASKSYFNTFFNRDCHHIPHNTNSVLEIIQRQTGVGETHHVTTFDGYILGLFRIPRTSPKGVILLQHGLGLDAKSWVAQYNESIAFLFWKAGYEVWLGNHRGNFYSQSHVSLKPNQEQFWDFSFHEMGYYDLNSTIEYVKMVSKVPKIIYFGYSLGATTGLVYTSLRPIDAENSIEIMVFLAPAFTIRFATTPLSALFQFVHFAVSKNLHTLVKWYSFPDSNSWYFRLLRVLNKFFPFKILFVYLMCFCIGCNPDEADPNYINLMLDQFGSATSLKNFAHYQQVSVNPDAVFQMYDYGKESNLHYYGVERPHLYHLEDMKTPVFTICGVSDTITTLEEIKFMYKKLPKAVTEFGQVEVEGFNHFDFLWNKRKNKVYYNLLKFLDGLRTKQQCPKDQNPDGY